MAGSTLTTVVVFAPLGLLTGVVGEFFRSFAIALAVAVLLSLALAMTLIPAVVAQWAAPRTRSRGAAARRIPRLSLRALEERYGRAIGWMLGAPRRGASARAAALLALRSGLSRVIGTGFLPEMDEGGFILDYWAPTGAALSRDRPPGRACSRGSCWPTPTVQAFTRRTGSELGFAATSPNRGDFTVLLKPRGAAGRRSTRSWIGCARRRRSGRRPCGWSSCSSCRT